jgi:hypothetical protein
VILDDLTLRVIFALTALVLLVLFLLTFRSTRSSFSLGWVLSLAFLLVGSSAYLLIGTGLQPWAVPVGNALTVVGLTWSWSAVRALRLKKPSAWAFVLPALGVGAAAALDSPATNENAGQVALYAGIAVLLGLSAAELRRAHSGSARSRRPLLVASAGLSAYYLGRLVFVVTGDFGSPVIDAAVSETVATLVTLLLLIVVGFSMAGLSHDESMSRIRARETKAKRELSEGAQVQQNLLPAPPPDLRGFAVSGACVPSRALSGDFFDWQRTSTGLVVTVADVMGKGIGAAMLGATIRAGLRIGAEDGPERAVSGAMRAIGSDLARNDAFATLFSAHLDEATGELTVLDAGHGLAVIVRSTGRQVWIRSGNLPLGLLPDQSWMVQRHRLEPGDRLLIFSDGVLDLFGGLVDSILAAASAAVPGRPADVPAAESVRLIQELAEAGAHEDDVTVVAIERLGARTAHEAAVTAPVPVSRF